MSVNDDDITELLGKPINPRAFEAERRAEDFEDTGIQLVRQLARLREAVRRLREDDETW